MKTLLYPLALLLSLTHNTVSSQTEDGTVRIPKMRLALQKGAVFPGADYSSRWKVSSNVYTTHLSDKFGVNDIFYDLAMAKHNYIGPVMSGSNNERRPANRAQQLALVDQKFTIHTGRPFPKESYLVVDYYYESDLEVIYNAEKTKKLLEEYLQKTEKKIDARNKETQDFIDQTLSKYNLVGAVAERLSADLHQKMTAELQTAIAKERETLKQDLLNDPAFLAELKKKLVASN